MEAMEREFDEQAFNYSNRGISDLTSPATPAGATRPREQLFSHAYNLPAHGPHGLSATPDRQPSMESSVDGNSTAGSARSFRSARSNDEPSVDDVYMAMGSPPPCAPMLKWAAAAGAGAQHQLAQWQVRHGSSHLRSPRRNTPLGHANHHDRPWRAAHENFVLDTPYGHTTTDSRWADAEAHYASLAAVAHTAGRAAAGPAAGVTSAQARGHRELPSIARESSCGALP